jgi:hypothetical protein
MAGLRHCLRLPLSVLASLPPFILTAWCHASIPGYESKSVKASYGLNRFLMIIFLAGTFAVANVALQGK